MLCKGQVDAEATYRLKYEDVATAAFHSPRACIDFDAINIMRNAPLSQRKIDPTSSAASKPGPKK